MDIYFDKNKIKLMRQKLIKTHENVEKKIQI